MCVCRAADSSTCPAGLSGCCGYPVNNQCPAGSPCFNASSESCCGMYHDCSHPIVCTPTESCCLPMYGCEYAGQPSCCQQDAQCCSARHGTLCAGPGSSCCSGEGEPGICLNNQTCCPSYWGPSCCNPLTQICCQSYDSYSPGGRSTCCDAATERCVVYGTMRGQCIPKSSKCYLSCTTNAQCGGDCPECLNGLCGASCGTNCTRTTNCGQKGCEYCSSTKGVCDAMPKVKEN